MIYFGAGGVVGGVDGGLAGVVGFIMNPITNTPIAARTIRYSPIPMENPAPSASENGSPPIASDIELLKSTIFQIPSAPASTAITSDATNFFPASLVFLSPVSTKTSTMANRPNEIQPSPELPATEPMNVFIHGKKVASIPTAAAINIPRRCLFIYLLLGIRYLAERQGFEPWVPVKGQ